MKILSELGVLRLEVNSICSPRRMKGLADNARAIGNVDFQKSK